MSHVRLGTRGSDLPRSGRRARRPRSGCRQPGAGAVGAFDPGRGLVRRRSDQPSVVLRPGRLGLRRRTQTCSAHRSPTCWRRLRPGLTLPSKRAGALDPADLLTAWREDRIALLDTLTALDPSRVSRGTARRWAHVAFATARLMETWAHGQDIVDAVGEAPEESTACAMSRTSACAPGPSATPTRPRGARAVRCRSSSWPERRRVDMGRQRRRCREWRRRSTSASSSPNAAMSPTPS